jgi:hypothetical protein
LDGADSEPKKQIPQSVVDAEEPAPGEIDVGAQEARQLSRGLPVRDLKVEADEAEHRRTESFRDHFERVAICALWVLFSSMGVIGGVWIWNLIMPVHSPAHWLDSDQMEKLQDILTGGIIAGLVADHFKRRMDHR